MNSNSWKHEGASNSQNKILICKAKHINKLDQEIRKNWKHVFKLMNLERVANTSQSPNKRVYTECEDSRLQRKNSNLKKMNFVHSQLKRQQVHQRHRKNEQIYFKKHACDFSSLEKYCKREKSSDWEMFGPPKRHSLNAQVAKPVQESAPFMLRRRTAKLQKEMGIIAHQYNDSLKKINHRQELKYSLNLQDRNNLVSSMKGSKVYYQFLKQWRSSDQKQTI